MNEPQNHAIMRKPTPPMTPGRTSFRRGVGVGGGDDCEVLVKDGLPGDGVGPVGVADAEQVLVVSRLGWVRGRNGAGRMYEGCGHARDRSKLRPSTARQPHASAPAFTLHTSLLSGATESAGTAPMG